MTNLILPSVVYLNQRLRYDPETGYLFWKAKPNVGHAKSWNARYAGKFAGRFEKDGYIRIEIDGQDFRAHRIVYKMIHGVEPPRLLDHRDGQKGRNTPENIRPATPAQNAWNTVARFNVTGYRGVKEHHSRFKRGWQAQITSSGKTYNLGTYPEAREASIAYKAASKVLRGEFHVK